MKFVTNGHYILRIRKTQTTRDWALFSSSGKRPLADVWALDTAAKPYEWRKLEPEGEGPPPCM